MLGQETAAIAMISQPVADIDTLEPFHTTELRGS
jgi:hypothetical protein